MAVFECFSVLSHRGNSEMVVDLDGLQLLAGLENMEHDETAIGRVAHEDMPPNVSAWYPLGYWPVLANPLATMIIYKPASKGQQPC